MHIITTYVIALPLIVGHDLVLVVVPITARTRAVVPSAK
jgi:hypothetical protein